MDENPASPDRRKLLLGTVTLAAAVPLATVLAAGQGAGNKQIDTAKAGAVTTLTGRRKLGALEVSSVGLGVQYLSHVFDLVDPLLTQPLMICAGSEADSLWQSHELYARAPGKSKELFIVEGASHMDLYDGSGRDAVLGKITPFFKANL